MRPYFICATALSFFASNISYAEINAAPQEKNTHLGIEYYSHKLDLKVSELQTSLSGATDSLLTSVKKRVNTNNHVKITQLRLDHQLTPYLKLYGALGKVTDTTRVNFSQLGIKVSDMVISDKGTAYSLGAKLQKHTGKWVTSVDYIHSRIHMDNNREEVIINSAVPSIGRVNKQQLYTLSLAYQGIKAAYSGIVSAPLVGDIPVTVNTQNKDEFQVLAGFKTTLGKDSHIRVDLGLNGQQQVRVFMSKAF